MLGAVFMVDPSTPRAWTAPVLQETVANAMTVAKALEDVARGDGHPPSPEWADLSERLAAEAARSQHLAARLAHLSAEQQQLVRRQSALLTAGVLRHRHRPQR